jgi:hypothetical protein
MLKIDIEEKCTWWKEYCVTSFKNLYLNCKGMIGGIFGVITLIMTWFKGDASTIEISALSFLISLISQP